MIKKGKKSITDLANDLAIREALTTLAWPQLMRRPKPIQTGFSLSLGTIFQQKITDISILRTENRYKM